MGLWPKEIGPTRTERQKRLAEIDSEIGKLEGEIAEITGNASQAGLVVS